MAIVEIIEEISWFQGKETKVTENVELNVGDHVGFKSDIEQSGKIIAMNRLAGNRYELILEDKDGFSGEYLRGSTRTAVHSDDIWVD